MPHPDMNPSWVNGHPDEGLLHEWLDEQLSGADAAHVELHVTDCAECRAAVAEARGLIAASHRILSALDDVPANVIPAPNSAAQDDFGARLDDLRRERAAVVTTPSRRAGRWQRFGRMAAVLLIALVPGMYFLRGDDVTVPQASVASDAAAPGMASITADSASPMQDMRVAAAPVREAESRASNTAAKASVKGESAVRESGAPAAAFVAPGPTGSAGPAPERAPRLAQSVAADSVSRAPSVLATSIPDVPATTFPGVTLRGKTAAVSSPPVVADQARQLTNERTADAARATEPRPTAPVPQMANAMSKPAIDTGIVPRARADSLGTNSEIERAVRRAAGSATVQGATRPTTLQLRAAPPVAAFDSVVLTRTVCANACESTVLHVSEGDVRYSVSAGNVRQPPVRAQLSQTARDRINALIMQAIPETVGLNGRLRCTVGRSTSAPPLDILITRGGTSNNLNVAARCSTDDAALLQLGTAIDAIVGTDALKRSTP